MSDKQLRHLVALSQLRRLNLSKNQLSEAGVENSAITDDCLDHMETMTSLRSVYLHGTNVTDVGMMHLSRMSQLEDLSLGSTKVTGQGLKLLKPLDRLRRLEATDSRVTLADVQQLAEFMSSVKVTIRGPASPGEKKSPDAQ